jgi:hypothetical protein
MDCLSADSGELRLSIMHKLGECSLTAMVGDMAYRDSQLKHSLQLTKSMQEAELAAFLIYSSRFAHPNPSVGTKAYPTQEHDDKMIVALLRLDYLKIEPELDIDRFSEGLSAHGRISVGHVVKLMLA